MKKTIAIAAGLALMGVVAVGAWAGPWQGRGGYGPGNCPGWGPGGGYQGQQLSKEEYAQKKEKLAAFMKETLPLRQKMVSKGMELRTERMQASPDEAKIKALTDEVIDLRSQIAKKANDAGLSGFWRMGKGYGRGFGPGMRGGGYGGGPGRGWR